jgi:hypothetical protein
MLSDLVKDNLCMYDKDSAHFIPYEEWEPEHPPRVRCYCDNCYYGRDKLAVRIKELELLLDKSGSQL